MSRDQRTHQQHHIEAAIHHEYASRNHREAARHRELGDDRAAMMYMRLADEHLLQACEHALLARERYAQTFVQARPARNRPGNEIDRQAAQAGAE